MRFLFVDKITAMSHDAIEGQVRFPHDEPWQHCGEIASGVVSEAIGQLCSWLSLKNNQFSARPVFLFADAIAISGSVPPGSTLDLVATINEGDDTSFVFSGSASLAGRKIVTIENCSGYFMPLSELEDPVKTASRFETLMGAGIPSAPSGDRYDFRRLIDALLMADERTLRAEKTFNADEPFYKDHFPRFPVTPIVVINEMIGQAAERLLIGEAPGARRRLLPRSVRDLKIKSFIRPGDKAETTVTVVERQGDEVETVVEVALRGKRILRGRYRYELKGDTA